MKIVSFALALALLSSAALAGQPVTIQNAANTVAAPVDATGLHVVCASGCSAGSSAAFVPTAGASKNLNVSSVSNDTTLPAGTVVVVTNTGSVDAFFRIQVGAGTALTTDYALKSGAAVGIAVGTATHISAITASSTTTFNLQGGDGQVTGYGGGGGAGSSGAVFGPTAVGSAAANPPVLVGGTANAGATGNVQVAKVDTSGNQYHLGGSTTIAHTCAVSGYTMEACLGQIDDDVKGPIPTQASTVSIGGVGLLAGTASAGSVGLDPGQTPATTVAVNISTATTTQMVALSSGKKIYVTGGVIIAGGTGNITLEYGTGSNCGTGTTVLSGAIPLVANVGFVIPANTFVVPASNALCILTSAAVQMSGALGYVQE